MVKFLCTRQDWIAERLGVQSLSFSGYLCPGSERLGDLEDLSPEKEIFNQEAVSGLFLLNKSLLFIQQLTRDMVTLSTSFSVLLIYITNSIYGILVVIGYNAPSYVFDLEITTSARSTHLKIPSTNQHRIGREVSNVRETHLKEEEEEISAHLVKLSLPVNRCIYFCGSLFISLH